VNTPSDTDEIVLTLERLRGEMEDLTVRGLRSAGPGHLTPLTALRDDLERTGAGYLAAQLGAVIDAIRADDRAAAAALLRAQASLRVFERVLTLEVVGDRLVALLAPAEEVGP
jgi:hypothetical protein